MIHRVQRFPFTIWFILLFFSALLSAMEESPIKMGPVLRFLGNDKGEWKVSVLYVSTKTGKLPSDLVYYDDDLKKITFAEILGEKFNYNFVRYSITVTQMAQRKKVTYQLPGEEKPHTFFVPALGQSPNILYHSCNGYQREADRKRVGGITPMWKEIIRRHKEEPFELQLGGGDQIYADGLIDKPSEDSLEPKNGKIFGLFALRSLQGWLSDKNSLGYAPFTGKMAQEVDRFYFDHYVKHFNKDGFNEALASIPMSAQPDDHDFYDGCGSYPGFLQESHVMKGIREIGAWYAFTIQHQLKLDEFPKRNESEPQGYNFLHVLNEGKMAILGVDTRSERTPYQVVSNNSWDNMFLELEKLGENCLHLLVMLGVPVVYASTKSLDKAFASAEVTPPVDKCMSAIPGMKNAFGLFELADDGRDGWGHKAHIPERNQMIKRFQEFSKNHHIRVTFLSGDVHLGGAGKIYCKKNGKEDCSSDAIWQIISSPVGNATPGKIATKVLRREARKEQDLDDDCAMKVFKLHKERTGVKGHSLIAHRNFLSFKLDPSDFSLKMRWSAESKKPSRPHEIYYLAIPDIEKKLTK